MRTIDTLIYAERPFLGKLFAEEKEMEEGTYRVIGDDLDGLRGIRAKKLYILEPSRRTKQYLHLCAYARDSGFEMKYVGGYGWTFLPME